MNKKRIAQYCCAALVAAGVGLNIQNAIADYGIAENSLSLVAVGGTNSGSNSNSNSNDKVENGQVKVIKKKHTGWKLAPTNESTKVPVKDDYGNIIGEKTVWKYVVVDAIWYECEIVDYTVAAFRSLCKSPNSAKQAGASSGPRPTSDIWA